MVQGQQLQDVRKNYYAAITNARAADSFYRRISALNHSDPLLLAYFGSAQALRARFSWNPYNKLSYLSDGIKTLKQAVQKDPDNLEIRFLRFSLVHYLPGFLGYGDTLEQDRRAIIELVKRKQFGQIEKDMLKNLVDFMKKSNRCGAQEIAILEQASNG